MSELRMEVETKPAGRQRAMWRGAASAVLSLGLLVVGAHWTEAQTLARPGWSGSGMTVAQWWRGAVLVEVHPGEALDSNGDAGAAKTGRAQGELARVADELDDLQVLGVDAILLRGIDAGTAGGGGQGRVNAAYGTLEGFDTLLEEASRRRIRILIEVPSSLPGDALAGAARFWLSRGVSGLYLGGGTGAAQSGTMAQSGTTGPGGVTDREAKEAALRGILRAYVGDRVLVGDAGDSTGKVGPEMVLTTVRGFASGQPADVAAVRSSLEEARYAAGRGSGSETVAQIDPKAGEVTGEAAKARLSVLLMVPGGVALEAGETGAGPAAQAAAAKRAQEASDQAALAAATSPAAVGNVKRAIARREAGQQPRYAGDAVFAWAQRIIGMHRGSPAMSRGEQTLLNFDAQGAVVSVWRGAAGPVLCEVVNLRDQPVDLSLKQGFTGLGLRGVFLRPVARTDAGMGAMPLEHVKLSAYGVFVGELGR